MASREICSSSQDQNASVRIRNAPHCIWLISVAGQRETDLEVTRTDVYEDFNKVRQKAGVEEWATKFVQRKYAFEEHDVEKGESEWMKVVYGFDRQLFTSNGATLMART